MATDIGKAYVQIVPSAQGIAGSITKVLGGESASAGKSAGSSILGGIRNVLGNAAGGFAGTGINIGRSMIGGTVSALKTGIQMLAPVMEETKQLGAELEQNLGGTEAVFGDFAGELQSSAKEAYKTMGLSASEYMATANKMGSLFQGSGIAQEKSLELTSAAMQRAADVASVMGLDTEAAMESIAGAAKGNFTMMDNLGVAMNATTLQAYALEKGINFKWNTASNAEKAELAMKMFMDRTSQYAGNFERESKETFSGALGAMTAAKQDLMANLFVGQDIMPSLRNLVDTTSTFLFDQLLPKTTQILSLLPPMIIEVLHNVVPEFGTKGLEMLSNLSQGFANGFPQIMGKIGELIGNIAKAIWNNRGQILQIGRNIVEGLIEGIKNMASSLGSALLSIVKDGWNGVKGWLGIASPSKKFMWLGEMTGAGLAEGLYDSSKMVQNAMNDLLYPVNNPAISTDLAYSGAGGMGGIVVTFNIDNSGKDITDKDIERWGKKITDVVNNEMGLMVG